MRVAALACLLVACGPGVVQDDAALDAGVDAARDGISDAGRDVGSDAPIACANEGDWTCTAPGVGSYTACCHGVLVLMLDGPCGPFDYPDVGPYPDAGSDLASLCAVHPRSSGCPCTVGAIDCDPTYHVVTCPAGTYTASARGCGACP